MWPVSLFFLKNLLLCIIVTLSSLPGKFKYSFMNNFLSWWNYSQLRFNWTKEYYIYIYIYIHICIFQYISISVYIYICICIYVYVKVYMCKCVCVYVYIHLYMHIYMCVYLCMYIYMSIHVHIWTCIHLSAYICTYIQHYCSLTITKFSAISSTLVVGRVLSLRRYAVSLFYCSNRLDILCFYICIFVYAFTYTL